MPYPILFIHGYLDSFKSWSRIGPELPPHISFISISLRGWGNSSKSGEYSIASYAADVAAIIEALMLPKAILCGHSMGTLIATTVAARYPDRVAGIILCGAAAKMNPNHVVDPSDGTTLGAIGAQTAEWSGEAFTDAAKEFITGFQTTDLQAYIAEGIIPKSFEGQVMEETLKADVRACRDCWKDMLEENHVGMLADCYDYCWGC